MTKIITQNDPSWVSKNISDSFGAAKERATEAQWQMVDATVKGLIKKYPAQWVKFQEDLKRERTEYQLATKDHPELRKRGFRNTASFPVFYKIDELGEIASVDCLEKIERWIPKLTHKDSVNYAEFLKRYPVFMPGDKF